MNNITVMELPFWKKIMYAFGQLGWSLTSYAVGNLLVAFYMSSDSGDISFPAFFSRGSIIGVLTVVGVIFALGRVFDAVTDPIIAGLSDRGRFKVGRRRFFLIVSIVPFTVLSVLAFMPPINGESVLNAYYVGAIVILYYLFMTMYVTPYFALLSEIGHDSKERLQLSTMISITWGMGFAIGTQIFTLQSKFEASGMDSLASFRQAIIIFAVIGFLFMLFPIIFIDENKYCEKHVSKEGIFEAVFSAFKNRNFLRFTLSDFAYWIALTCITTGMIYYITVLLEQSKEMVSWFQFLMFALSFLFYVPTNLLANKFGKKRMMIFGFGMFLITYSFTFFLGRISFLSPMQQGYIVVVLSAIPLAIFGILPNATIADIAEADGIVNRNYKAGIFFGARTFMSKLGQSVAGILFPSLLLLGKDVGDDLGIRLTAVAASLFVIAGLLLLLSYNEKEINHILKYKNN